MSDAITDRYKRAFALRDNPFSPVFEFPRGQPLYANLTIRPLMVHKATQLGKLFVQKAGAFQTHMSDYQEWLNERGYSADIPSRGGDHHIALIAGDQGTGKTTLASKMIELTCSMQPEGEPKWVVFDDLEEIESDTATTFRQAIEKLENDITRRSSLNDYCCILIDNVKEGSLNDALRIYDQFKNVRFIFLFMTTSDLALIRYDGTNSGRPIVKYRMEALNPNEAVAFVEDRIDKFRDPRLKELTDDLRFYPYQEENIRNAVQPKDDVAPPDEVRARQNPITLRVFNQYLNMHLMKRLREYRRVEGYRIDDQSREALINSRIDLSDKGAMQ